MKTRNCPLLGCIVVLLLALFGCHREHPSPPPLAVEQIPAELDKAFQSAKPEAKDLISQIKSALQKKDYPTAYQAVTALNLIPYNSRDQKVLTARALMSLNGLLQTSEAQGDARSAETLNFYRKTK